MAGARTLGKRAAAYRNDRSASPNRSVPSEDLTKNKSRASKRQKSDRLNLAIGTKEGGLNKRKALKEFLKKDIEKMHVVESDDEDDPRGLEKTPADREVTVTTDNFTTVGKCMTALKISDEKKKQEWEPIIARIKEAFEIGMISPSTDETFNRAEAVQFMRHLIADHRVFKRAKEFERFEIACGCYQVAQRSYKKQNRQAQMKALKPELTRPVAVDVAAVEAKQAISVDDSKRPDSLIVQAEKPVKFKKSTGPIQSHPISSNTKTRRPHQVVDSTESDEEPAGNTVEMRFDQATPTTKHRDVATYSSTAHPVVSPGTTLPSEQALETGLSTTGLCLTTSTTAGKNQTTNLDGKVTEKAVTEDEMQDVQSTNEQVRSHGSQFSTISAPKAAEISDTSHADPNGTTDASKVTELVAVEGVSQQASTPEVMQSQSSGVMNGTPQRADVSDAQQDAESDQAFHKSTPVRPADLSVGFHSAQKQPPFLPPSQNASPAPRFPPSTFGFRTQRWPMKAPVDTQTSSILSLGQINEPPQHEAVTQTPANELETRVLQPNPTLGIAERPAPAKFAPAQHAPAPSAPNQFTPSQLQLTSDQMRAMRADQQLLHPSSRITGIDPRHLQTTSVHTVRPESRKIPTTNHFAPPNGIGHQTGSARPIGQDLSQNEAQVHATAGKRRSHQQGTAYPDLATAADHRRREHTSRSRNVNGQVYQQPAYSAPRPSAVEQDPTLSRFYHHPPNATNVRLNEHGYPEQHLLLPQPSFNASSEANWVISMHRLPDNGQLPAHPLAIQGSLVLNPRFTVYRLCQGFEGQDLQDAWATVGRVRWDRLLAMAQQSQLVQDLRDELYLALPGQAWMYLPNEAALREGLRMAYSEKMMRAYIVVRSMVMQTNLAKQWTDQGNDTVTVEGVQTFVPTNPALNLFAK